MSENENRGARDFSQYDTMTTEELDELLRFDTDAPEGEEPDVELILYVLEVLDKRGRITEVTGNKAQEAYESFKKDYLSEDIHVEEDPKPAKRRPLHLVRRLTTAAAAVLVFVMLGTVTANAFGFNFWRAIAVWAQETFHFEMNGEVDTEEPEPVSNLEYASMEEMIFKLEKVSGIVPTWIPEEYELTDITVLENPMQKVYSALYQHGDLELKITIRSYLIGYPEQIEQNDACADIDNVEGVTYYYFTNYDQNRVAWINGSYECYISGDATIDQLEKMVDSI